ncbi:MAG: M10 family metallopeptidase [Pseudomonadota bacterium]
MAHVRGVSATSSLAINTLLGGTSWWGQLTYAFPSFAPSDVGAITSGAHAVSPALRAAVREAFDQVSGFTKLSVRETHGHGDVRILEADSLVPPGASAAQSLGAYAFLPGNYQLAGDIFFGSATAGDLREGSYGFRTVLHEVGHALGLKHPNEIGAFGRLPAHLDGAEHSVMSARGAPGQSISEGLGIESGGFSQTFMPADIAALQHLYGADYSNARSTHYRFDVTERVVMETIWDSGGRDTYNFSQFSNDLSISLWPGQHSTTGQEPQLNRAQELRFGDDPIFAEGSIHNAFLFRGDKRSLIENAIGGRGDDKIVGNVTANKLYGQAGDDWIFGSRGSDYLGGGSGNDTLLGGDSADVIFGSYGNDSLRGNDHGDRLFGEGGNDRIFGDLGNDYLGGGYGDDILVGGHSHDVLRAGPGDDWLHGGYHNDRLFGDGGDDILLGASGNDTLYGGPGADTLTGGAGADVFHLTAGDVVTDFSAGDTLDVPFPRGARIASYQDGDDAAIWVGPRSFAHLLDTNLADLGADVFV